MYVKTYDATGGSNIITSTRNNVFNTKKEHQKPKTVFKTASKPSITTGEQVKEYSQHNIYNE